VALRRVPIIDLKMRLGEASGAAVASLLVRAACAMHNGMATFDEAGANRNNTS
jgi:nicotinate-nucleotide--dimethylbenzimidazole phosphoribosyltransferase